MKLMRKMSGLNAKKLQQVNRLMNRLVKRVKTIYNKRIYNQGSLVQSCNISDYNVGGDGDLFKSPEPIMELPVITCGEDDEFLSNVFKEMLEKEAEIELSPLSEVLNYKFEVKTDESSKYVHPPGQIPKSMSSDCLNSMNWIHGARIEPGFLDVTELDFGNVYGMRRAFSDGDIKTLDNVNGYHRHSFLGQPQLMSDHIVEDRWRKLSRYRNKKTKRNFGRKIKYACRKALADSQPRIRGRFATKTDESEIWRK